MTVVTYWPTSTDFPPPQKGENLAQVMHKIYRSVFCFRQHNVPLVATCPTSDTDSKVQQIQLFFIPSSQSLIINSSFENWRIFSVLYCPDYSFYWSVISDLKIIPIYLISISLITIMASVQIPLQLSTCVACSKYLVRTYFVYRRSLRSWKSWDIVI